VKNEKNGNRQKKTDKPDAQLTVCFRLFPFVSYHPIS
jgi:hypothetical protein